MDKKLFCQAIIKYSIGVLSVFFLLFIPAGSLKYRNGWLFMGLLFIPMLIFGTVLMIKNPTLLRKRLNANEKEKEQKKVILLSGLMFVSGFIAAGLDFRLDRMLSDTIVIASSVIFLAAYILFAAVISENEYLSRTIEVQEGQRVIDTGFYRFVRHPLYSASILMFLSAPLILGSVISFIIFLFYPAIIVKRIKNEESVLEKDLNGYCEYEDKVKYRLIPFIW